MKRLIISRALNGLAVTADSAMQRRHAKDETPSFADAFSWIRDELRDQVDGRRRFFLEDLGAGGPFGRVATLSRKYRRADKPCAPNFPHRRLGTFCIRWEAHQFPNSKLDRCMLLWCPSDVATPEAGIDMAGNWKSGFRNLLQQILEDEFMRHGL